MKFHTREWHEGVTTEEEADRLDRAHAEHVLAVGPLLPSGVAVLAEAGGDQSLHDGRFAGGRFEDGSLVPTVDGYHWTGDFPMDPLRFVIRYEHAAPLDLSESEFLERVNDPETEILYSEFDV